MTVVVSIILVYTSLNICGNLVLYFFRFDVGNEGAYSLFAAVAFAAQVLAILTMMSIIASIMISNPMLLVLTLLFLVLLVPYIMHYYTLENEVQKMYTQYDEILKHLS